MSACHTPLKDELPAMVVVACQVCEKQPSKYKCPACQLRYCSLVCYKVHKTTHTQPDTLVPASFASHVQNAPKQLVDDREVLAEQNNHATPKDSYNELLTNPELQHLLTRYPDLRAQLKTIYTATLEPAEGFEDDQVRRHGRSGRGQSRGRGGRYAQLSKAPWMQERGMKKAMYQLKKMRGLEAGKGEGLREFSDIVKKIRAEGTLLPGEDKVILEPDGP